MDLGLVLDNSAGAGPAEGVYVRVSLPAGVSFAGPDSLAPYGYSANDRWAEPSFFDSDAVRRGPYTVPAGSTLNVPLTVQLQNNVSSGLLQLPVLAEQGQAAATTLPLTINSGLAPSRTPTPSFTVSPTFSVSPTPTSTITVTAFAGTPTSTPLPTFTATPTTQPPNLIASVALASDPALFYVDRAVSFTVSVQNLAGPVANDVRIYAVRDVDSGNLATEEDPAFPVLQNGESTVAWYYVNDDQRNTTDWKRGPYNSILAGSAVTPVPGLNFKLRDSAAGQTITTLVKLYIGGNFTGVSASTSVLVPLYTPTPAVPNTPTITPTPIVGVGRMAAYPQPAHDRSCFDYIAPMGAGGDLTLEVYNLAFQKVAQIKDHAMDGVLQTTCVDISGIAPGLYFVRAQQGSYQYPALKFGIVR